MGDGICIAWPANGDLCICYRYRHHALITGFLRAEFTPDILVIGTTAVIGAGATCLLGLFGAWRSLGHRPAPHLRELA